MFAKLFNKTLHIPNNLRKNRHRRLLRNEFRWKLTSPSSPPFFKTGPYRLLIPSQVLPSPKSTQLSTTITPRYKRPITILTPTSPIIRTLNTPSTHSTLLALISPEKCPTIGIHICHFCSCGSSTGIGCASAIWCPMWWIILVVRDKDGECLGRRCACVVGTFGCLDCGGCFGR